MPVYMIVDIAVKDRAVYSQYVERVRAVVEAHGGRYLARGGKVVPIAGGWNPERVIIVEFDGMEDVRACFGSAEYRAIAPLRERSAESRVIVVEGC